MLENRHKIEKLLHTSEFKELLVLAERLNFENKKFDLLSVFDKLINENAWSRLFGYLLKSQGDHGLGQQVFRNWLDKNKSNASVSDFIKKCPAEDESQITVITEWYTEINRKLDILIKIQDSEGKTKAIVGIENKLNSAELTNQVSDYQKSLHLTFRKIPKILFFLTPNGRPALTAANTTDCPCIPTSYSLLRDVFNEIISKGAGQAEVLLSVITNHINKLIKSNNMEREIKELVRNLYETREHRQALKLICRYIPSIKGVFEGLGKTIEDNHNPNISTQTFGATEFKVYDYDLVDLCKQKGITHCFMLHSETKNPDIGDKFVFRLMLLYDRKGNKTSFNEIRDIILEQASLPNSLGTSKHWWQWINIWVGRSYQLVDLGEKDIIGLKNLLDEGIDKTYEQLKQRLKKLSESSLI